MRNLIIYFLLLSSFLATAQNDSVNISFSEEKVENFEKTTLIDEYEKAFGNNRVVKSALRVSLTGIPSTYLSRNYTYPIKDFIRTLNPIIQFEQKISVDKSLIVNFSSNRADRDIFWNTDIGLEGRWYYKMKERIASEKQQSNITGKYLSLKVEANPYKYNPSFSYLAEMGYSFYMFRATSTYSFNWGWQLGNNANYGISIGVQHGNKAIINNKNFWVDGAISDKTATNFFVSTNAKAGLGLFFPFKKRTASNYCDFLQCNYEVKQLFKINLNNILYLDRYSQGVNLDVAYERKIGHSPFSINSNARTALGNRVAYRVTGVTMDTTSVFGGSNIRSREIYSHHLQNYLSYDFEITEQLRYYIGMKNRIVKGKSANNLNGMYVGLLGSYRFQKQQGDYTDIINNYSIANYNTKQLSVGLCLGYQIQTNRKSFLDISTSFLRQNYNTYINNNETRDNINSIINFSLKMGFAK